ncbi:MAG: hypothetical protein AAF639_05485 [Chloroflexota bacterium]
MGTNDFKQLYKNIEVVREAQAAGEQPNYRILPLFVTHMAHRQALQAAENEGILVVQSFEW